MLRHSVSRQFLRRCAMHLSIGLSVFSCGALRADAIPAWEGAEPVQALLGGVRPQMEGARLELPAITQDGSSVLLSAAFDQRVEKVYLFALGNPSPELAEIQFGPAAHSSDFSMRVRLNESQTVVLLARKENGIWLGAAQSVRVTISGCLSRDSAVSGVEMQARLRITPERVRSGQVAEVRTLINHPMETGLRKDDTGQLVPERLIRQFRATFEGQPILTAHYHRAVSANPYFLFQIMPSQAGSVECIWEEDGERTVKASASVSVN